MHRSAHVEHSANSTQRVVLVRSREAEEPDQLVAQGPLDARTMTLENFGGDTHRAGPDASGRLRVEAEIRCCRDIDGGDRDCALARKPSATSSAHTASIPTSASGKLSRRQYGRLTNRQ